MRIAITWGAVAETDSPRLRSKIIIAEKVIIDIIDNAKVTYMTYPIHVMTSFVTDDGGVHGAAGGLTTSMVGRVTEVSDDSVLDSDFDVDGAADLEGDVDLDGDGDLDVTGDGETDGVATICVI